MAAVINALTLTGIVQKRIFHNSGNGYCILSVSMGNLEEVVVTGYMAVVRENAEYEFTGRYIDHPKYGEQFKFTDAKIQMPSTTAGMAQYLAGVTSGVGIKKAEKIVNALGGDVLQKINADPSLLNALTFLTERQRAEIAANLMDNTVQAELAGIVCKPNSGIGMGIVTKIIAQYGEDAIRIVKENPYILTNELWGVGFIKADAIAQSAGVPLDSPFRIEAAVDFVLRESANAGHVYLRPRDVIAQTIGDKGLLAGAGIAVSDIAIANQKLVDDLRCVRDGDCIYSKQLYDAECAVADSVARMLSDKITAPEALDALIADAQGTSLFSHEQRQAIISALTNPLSVVTGPPGSGKTHTLQGITRIYKKLYPQNTLYLCAPTGRAAKRMSDATNEPATTIHRLLAYAPMLGFRHNSANPLHTPSLLVADEVSMIDVELASALFSAIAAGTQVVLVGDVDQLPSVGAGNVLRDIIASATVPTVRLSYNYRQANGSKISEYADMICHGLVPPLISAGDFEYIAVEDAKGAQSIVLQLVAEIVAAGHGQLDWSVMAPMRRGECGVTQLNTLLREIANPVSTDIFSARTFGQYQKNDKVMVIKNDYSLGIFNGDMGIVKYVGDKCLGVDFGESVKEIDGEKLELLTLAYASTIHKAQGSEFPIVIMPLVKQHYMMLQRNLLYTGITRAKVRLVLVADEWSVRRAVSNNVIEERNTKLADRIIKITKGVKEDE